jgi:hypothetical protein
VKEDRKQEDPPPVHPGPWKRRRKPDEADLHITIAVVTFRPKAKKWIALGSEIPDKCGPFRRMRKATAKTTEAQLLELLKKVLPKATHDPQLAGKIYQAVEQELKAKTRATAFDKFCTQIALPDLEPKTLDEVKRQFAESFGDGDVTLRPNRREKSLAVEVALADGTQFRSEIKVRSASANADGDGDDEPPAKFVPFPVCLPGDKELVWLLAKRETLTPDEAGLALTKSEEDFWASKTGQKLMRDRVERSFSEFIARVPGGALSEVGLKRHYKEPEPLKLLHPLTKR